MSGPHMAIAGYLRERREAERMTRTELATRAGISEGLIQKLEQGIRPPTPTALNILFEALGVPPVFRDYAAIVLQPELTTISDAGLVPSRAELVFLESVPHPACYVTTPAQDIVATNTAYARAFPGQEPGTNIIAWMLLDPRARVAVDDWEREAHVMVQAFRHMAPGITAPERIAEIIRLVERSPDWHRLWSTDIPPADMVPRPLRIRPVDDGAWTAMHAHLLRCALPRRDWRMFCLVPISTPL
ncbi:helix-turn-helix transcriptional regulator [Nocardia uniformis]|uniref:Helix-turn-helix transcriptional regulator n=1 Tax=Nocardia uniformis TaxID=53432 RepID=A0A849C4V8_9NOCA|nr:helix-turn-helix domain-containing protein [Nocardia uniformis]NNH70837.1 helix-turn-helix transcriptional regulator [Nocardia uniformis]